MYAPETSYAQGVCFIPTTDYENVNRIQMYLFGTSTVEDMLSQNYRLSVQNTNDGCRTEASEMSYGYPATQPTVSTTEVFLENFDLNQTVSFFSGFSYRIFIEYLGTVSSTTNNGFSTKFVATRTNASTGTNANRHLFGLVDSTFGTSSSNYSAFALINASTTNPIPDPVFDDKTRIIDFNPQNGATTTSPVTFSLEAYVNENDIGTVATIQITLENIDQNVLLLGFLSPSQITLVDENIETGGYFNFSTTTVVIGDGNYRVEACIKRTFFGGLFGGFFESSLVNLFSDVSDCQSHQFVVGTSTFIGNISQNLWGDTNAFLEGLNATSSEALASTCNPLNLNFDIRQCIVFLTVPDANSLAEVIDLAREGILTRWPWGYGTRFIQILTNSPTSTLPVVVVPILTNTGNDTTLTFDFGDMVAGGGALLDSVSDPVYGKNVRDVFEPFIILFISLLVVIIIVNDLMRIGRDRDSKDIQNNKYH